jgi:lectin-like protein
MMLRKREPSSAAATLLVLGRALFQGALLALGLLSAVVESHAGVLASPVTNPSNGHLYFLLTSNTWTASEAEAESLGGHLVTINDSEEQDWVFESFGTFGDTAKVLWIGLTDRDHEGIFAWLSGEKCEFTNWEEGQPDDARGAEDYVGIWPPGPRHPSFWNDWPDDTWTGSGWAGMEFTASMHGVVEIVPDVWTGPGWAGAELTALIVWGVEVDSPILP